MYLHEIIDFFSNFNTNENYWSFSNSSSFQNFEGKYKLVYFAYKTHVSL